MYQDIFHRMVTAIQKGTLALRTFFKKNYRNYYDDRSWWDEVGSEKS